jgi:hypothetical protein
MLHFGGGIRTGYRVNESAGLLSASSYAGARLWLTSLTTFLSLLLCRIQPPRHADKYLESYVALTLHSPVVRYIVSAIDEFVTARVWWRHDCLLPVKPHSLSVHLIRRKAFLFPNTRVTSARGTDPRSESDVHHDPSIDPVRPGVSRAALSIKYLAWGGGSSR